MSPDERAENPSGAIGTPGDPAPDETPHRPRSLDLARLSRADRLVLASSAAFLAWTLIPLWYRFRPGGIPIAGFDVRIGGWHGVTVVPALLAVAQILWVGLRLAGVEVFTGRRRGFVDLTLAGAAELLALVALLVQPEFFDVWWGLFVAQGLGLAWVSCAWLRFLQPVAP